MKKTTVSSNPDPQHPDSEQEKPAAISLVPEQASTTTTSPTDENEADVQTEEEEMPQLNEPINPSEQDLQVFGERLESELKKNESSGRKLEDKIGIARGSISKIKSGRMKLSLKLLREISEVLQVNPAHLVQGTSLATLLRSAPEKPISDELANARKEIDSLKIALARAEATEKELQKEVGNLRTQAREHCQQATEWELKYGDLESKYEMNQNRLTEQSIELATKNAQIQNLAKELETKQKEAHALKQQNGKLEAEKEKLGRSLKEMGESLKAVTKERDQLQDRFTESQTVKQNLTIELQGMKTRLSKAEDLAQSHYQRWTLASNESRTLQSQLIAKQAELCETQTQMQQWREEALQRRQRMDDLESQLLQAQQRIQERSPEVGAFVLGTLAGLGIGAAVGSSSGSSKRGRR